MALGCVTSFLIDVDSLQRTFLDEDELKFKIRSIITNMPSHSNERNFTTTFTGGSKRSCSKCSNDTFFPSYACSDGDGVWNGGELIALLV